MSKLLRSLVLGLIKGGVIGGALGGLAWYLQLDGVFHWLLCGVVGFFIGALLGKPFWKHISEENSTFVTVFLKSIFGAGIGIGIYALALRFWDGADLTMLSETRNLLQWQPIIGVAIGGIYGAFVEIDDSF